MGTSPRITPSLITAATLYSLLQYSNGSPTTVNMFLPLVYSVIVASDFCASLSSVSCRNRSLHVYPVMHISGKTITETCASYALSIRLHICSVLKMQSATFISGVTTSTLTYPSFMYIISNS